MIFPGEQLVNELKELGFVSIEGPWDEKYFVPHKLWLDEFSQWWMRDVRPCLIWTPDKFDCDDFARRARDRATDALLKTNIEGATVAFCYAKVYLSLIGNPFKIDTGSHCTNFVRCQDGKWYWWDAYSGGSVACDGDFDSLGIARLNFVLV